MTLEGGEWSILLWLLYCQLITLAPIEQDSGWVPLPMYSFVEEEISLVSAKIQTPDGPAHTLVTIPTILHLLKSERSSVKIVPVSLLCELHDTLISTF